MVTTTAARLTTSVRSQTPVELAHRGEPCALWSDQFDATLDRQPAARPHGVHDHRRTRLATQVAKLDPVDVEIERAVVVDRVHHRDHVRPPGRSNGRKTADPL